MRLGKVPVWDLGRNTWLVINSHDYVNVQLAYGEYHLFLAIAIISSSLMAICSLYRLVG